MTYQNDVYEKIEKVYKFIFGNGSPGMDEEMRSIEKRLEGIEKFIQEQEKKREDSILERKKEAQYYLRTTVGTALAALIILIFNGIVWFVKILPVLDALSKTK